MSKPLPIFKLGWFLIVDFKKQFTDFIKSVNFCTVITTIQFYNISITPKSFNVPTYC